MNVFSKKFLGALLFFILLGCAFFLFSIKISHLTEENMEKRLIETAGNNVVSIQTMFNKDIDFLNGVASELANRPELTDASSISLLHTLIDHIGFSRMTIDLADGTCYTSDGLIVKISNMNYLNEALTGKSVITNIYRSPINNEECISILVPIYKNGVVVGALRGVYQSDMLIQFIDLKTFDGAGYFNLIDSNGNFLFKPGKFQNIFQSNNLFDILREVKFQKNYTLEQFEQDLAAEQSNFTIYSLMGEERYVYYKPIGIDHWYIMSVVPTNYLQKQKVDIDIAVGILLIALFCLFSILMGYIIFQHRRTQKMIENEKDYLEKILNNIPLPVFITDHNRVLDFVNDAVLLLFGKEKSAILGGSCAQFGTSICNTSDCAIEKMIHTGKCQTYLAIKEKHYMVTTAFLGEDHTASAGFIEVIQDISEIVEMKNILEERTLELETISENLLGGVLITRLDPGFPIIHCNQGYCDLVGTVEESIVGKFAIDLVAPEDAKETEQKILNQLSAKGLVAFEHKIIKSDGTKIWVSLYGKTSKFQGKPVGIWMLIDISDYKEAERQLKINEERYRIAAQNTEDIIIDYNLQTKLMIHTAKATEIYGVPEYVENAPESILAAGLIEAESVDNFLNLFYQIRSGAPKESCILHTRAKDGRHLWNKLSFTTIFDTEQNPVRAIGILQDITNEQNAKRQYEREVQYREIMLQDSILHYEMDLTNHVFISGHEMCIASESNNPTDDYNTVLPLLIHHWVDPADHVLVWNTLSSEALMAAYAMGKRKVVFEYRRKINAAETAWVECTLCLLAEEQSENIHGLCYIKNINELKLQELSLRQKAERDLLTGLFNKITTENLIKEQLNSGRTMRGAFFLIDLDDFKKINDTLGHAFGDSVLSDVSQKLLTLFGDTAIIGRIGGDEFIIFMSDIHEIDVISAHAARICDVFHSTYTGKDHTYKVSGTIGISLFPEHGLTFQDLYKKADLALYDSKKNGKDTFSIYHP